MYYDIINSGFVFIGSLLVWRNVYKLHKEKEVKGIYWSTNAFFMLWGIWNLIFYSSLNQLFSLFSGISLVIANIIWLILALYYKGEGND